MIRFEIDNAVFGIAEARRHLIGVDPQAQAALAMFGEAQKLLELSKGSKTKAHVSRSSDVARECWGKRPQLIGA